MKTSPTSNENKMIHSTDLKLIATHARSVQSSLLHVHLTISEYCCVIESAVNCPRTFLAARQKCFILCKFTSILYIICTCKFKVLKVFIDYIIHM